MASPSGSKNFRKRLPKLNLIEKILSKRFRGGNFTPTPLISSLVTTVPVPWTFSHAPTIAAAPHHV